MSLLLYPSQINPLPGGQKAHSDYTYYKTKRNKVKSKIKAAQISYEQSLNNKFHSNPKAFHSYIKSKQQGRGVGPLERSDGAYTSGDFEIADDLNKFFESTFTREDITNMPVPAFRYNESISNVNISESVVLQKLMSLKDNKSPGPDGLHSYVLKSCAHTLCAPLTKLFCQSLAEGIRRKWLTSSPF